MLNPFVRVVIVRVVSGSVRATKRTPVWHDKTWERHGQSTLIAEVPALLEVPAWAQPACATVAAAARNHYKCKAIAYMTATDSCPGDQADLLDTIAAEHVRRPQR